MEEFLAMQADRSTSVLMTHGQQVHLNSQSLKLLENPYKNSFDESMVPSGVKYEDLESKAELM